MLIRESNMYQVGPRTTLRSGAKFKATHGPYYTWTNSDGTLGRETLAERGPYTFIRYATDGRREWIEAYNGGGGFCVLQLLRESPSITPCVVNRPYRIVGTTSGQSQAMQRRDDALRDRRRNVRAVIKRSRLKVTRVRLQLQQGGDDDPVQTKLQQKRSRLGGQLRRKKLVEVRRPAAGG